MPGPLAHLRVVDVTDLRGALAGRLLADLGADVVKVEPPGGDPGRRHPPFAGGVAAPDRSLAFLYRNANKRGAVVDLHDADGWHRFERLLERADVLLENFGPALQHRHGLAPDEIRRRHPHLVHVAIADFGLAGPRAGWRLEPLPAFAASGALHAAGFPELPPCWLPGYAAHDAASAFAVAGALAALLDRARQGGGQTVEVSVQEAAMSGLHPWAIAVGDYARVYPMLPTAPPRNADGAYCVLATADGYVRVLPGSPRQWRAWVALLGSPEALQGDHWEVPLFRLANGDVVRLVASDVLRDRPRAQVLAEGRRLDVPITPLNTPEAFVDEAQTRARGFFRQTGFSHLGDAPFAACPLNFSATPAALRRPAPAPGEDDRSDFPPRPAVPPSSTGGSGPVLAGLRVVDLGVGVAIPETGCLLAELGAEVVKIESAANVDFLRRVTVEPGAVNRSWTFNDASRGHRSVCVDLREPRGRALALRLCAAADVVLENNRGGVAAAWGLDYDDVRRLRPDVIYVASQGYGRGGPLGEVSAYGPLNSAFAGVTWLWNHPGAPYPAGSSLNHPDHVAAKLAAVAVLAALEHRRRSGEGQRIEMSQAEAAAYLQGEAYLEAATTGRPAGQRGNAALHACPHGVYPSAGEDRWLAIAVVGDDAWARFAACLGWPPEPALATLAGRLAVRDALDGRVAAWTRARTGEEAAAALQAAGISAMSVQHGDDHRADPHLAARGALVTVEHAEIGPARHCGNPLRLSRTPLVTAAAAPCLGADTADVLREWLGLGADEVTPLVAGAVCR
jgi:crotonobetainyl-CoA:carnitine CoA-transferase CaiB-like acyl-CoA transferase